MGNREIVVETEHLSDNIWQKQSEVGDKPCQFKETKIWLSDQGTVCVAGDNILSELGSSNKEEALCAPADIDKEMGKTTKKTQKQVRFNDDHLFSVFEFEDDEDSKQMRRLYWETYAIDRARFRDRVCVIEAAIGHIFQKEHRDKVYLERIMSTQADKNAGNGDVNGFHQESIKATSVVFSTAYVSVSESDVSYLDHSANQSHSPKTRTTKSKRKRNKRAPKLH